MLHIREATEADVPDILRIYAAAGLDGDRAYTAEEARRQFAIFRSYPHYRLYLAVVDGSAAGTYSLLIQDKLAKRGQPSGIVEDVAVDPASQRQGVGRAMMEHAREECRKAGCYKLTLSSNLKREEAHRFYDQLGFERHGYSFLIRP
jgi:GNAT superfamily N-acetyltransferase